MSRLKFLHYTLKSLYSSTQSESVKQCFLVTVTQSNIKRKFSSIEKRLVEEPDKRTSVLEPAENVDLSDFGSVPLPSFNFAAYADKSPLLQEFIKMKVNLFKLEQRPDVAKYLLTLNFEKNVKPCLVFLRDNGVPAEEFGSFITRNPFIFKEPIEDLQVRINYLESKKFDKNMISNIIRRNPKWLSTPVTVIDSRLGYLQKTLQLKGDHVRKLVTELPLLGTIAQFKLETNVFALKEEMDLDIHEMKKLVLKLPYVLKIDSIDLIKTYDYLQSTMNVPRHIILQQPAALKTRKYILNERHKFLESLGRAQYNPLLTGYIPLEEFVKTSDEEFCIKLAKTSIHTFNEFLKTI